MKQAQLHSVTALSVGALFVACASSGVTDDMPASAPGSTASALSKKDKAVALLESLETGDPTPVSYINPTKYIQHNLSVGDGLEGFGEVMKHKPPQGFKAKVVRSLEDGDFVATHTIYDFFGPKIGFDVFRFEDGVIVEHWDNLIDVMPANVSGHSQTDGPTTVVDLDKTEANKALVREFYQRLVNGQMDQLGAYFDGDNYIQHNPAIGDGLSGLGSALQEMAKSGMVMTFTKIHRVIGEGNFVLVMAEGTFGGKPYAFYDLFRVADGKIAEHWDVMAEIPPKSEWKNQNGKF